MSSFCISCDSFKSNICNGLTSLQRNEEFVDMTLAADGHFVKVHQMVVSLASPYLKQLILSAPCPHPVVFLNKISYPILCYILEYIYSGEVMVNKNSLSEFIEAGKQLHIKGLQDMQLQPDKPEIVLGTEKKEQKYSSLFGQLPQFQSQSTSNADISKQKQESVDAKRSYDDNVDDPFADIEEIHNLDDDNDDNDCDVKTNIHSQPKSNVDRAQNLQFTLSNCGQLQLILNRYMYHLNYSHKNSPTRTWRCVDSRGTTKCRATVVTKEDIVVRRHFAHSHGFHDKRIMKKIASNAIFTAIKDAEKHGKETKSSQNT